MSDYSTLKQQMAGKLSEKMTKSTTGISESALLDAIDRLSKESKRNNDNTDVLNKLMKELIANGHKELAEALKLMSEKMDSIIKVVEDKPDSFELDIRRNSDGFMTKLLIKPA